MTSDGDPMKVPMIFLRVGWMNRYQGQSASDLIKGGGSYVKDHGFGHEIFNFRPFNGRVYGYVQPPGSGYNEGSGAGININKLGASSSENSISDILAVWVATAPQGGCFIVGWYNHATVHRRWQPPSAEANRTYEGNELGYYVTAASEDATLLPPDERLFEVPRGAGGIGQANIWYADSHETHRQFRSSVLEYLENRRINPPPPQPRGGVSRQPDPLLRQKVEQAAVDKTTEHYSQLGYVVDSKETDNLGWDLIAVHAARGLELKLEVKGLSGPDCRIELTPNEYAKLKEHRDSYRVCVVTQALISPELAIFEYSPDSQRWQDQAGKFLEIEEFVGARCRSG